MASQGGTINLVAKPLVSQALRQIDQGHHEAAAQSLIGYLRQHPGDGDALAALGKAAMMLGALGQADRFIRQAIASGVNTLENRRNLASILNQQERLTEALAMFQALGRESPDVAFPAIEAIILNKLGRTGEAMAIHQRLAEANPDTPQLWISYGHDLRAAGRVDEAIAAYRRVCDADNEFGDAWWGLASIKRPVLSDADIAAMHEGLSIAVDVRHSAPLNFALARAYHDRGDHARAFAHYDEGNRLRAESLRYDARELTDEVSEIERRADSAFFEAMSTAPVGSADQGQPVFIICLPRSGSTLLEQMLGSHPAIEPVGELPYIPAILRTLMEMATRQGKVSVPQVIAGLNDAQAAAMGQDYLRRVAAHRQTDRPLFVDKLPHNWSNVPFIRRILPQARFIDIRRPAMDCCFSNFTQSFTSAHASSFALRDVGQCYVDYVRMMTHLDRAAPGMVHHLPYTSLIENPREELAGVLSYLGQDWDDAVLSYHKLDRAVRTPSSEQVRRPLNRDGMEIWKPFSQWLDPLREVLGDLAEG